MSKKIMIITGEASGDLHGANLVKELRALSAELEITGIGGVKMREAGVIPLFDIKELALVGFVEVVSRFRRLREIFQATVKFIEQEELSALILIDSPGFNLRLADRVRRRKPKLPIIYYISPQVWAWGKGRVKKIAHLVDKMLVIFPFEVDIYRSQNLAVEFIGHPLLDTIKEETPSREALGASLGVTLDKPLVGLLPGSRPEEIRRLLPLMLKAAKLMRQEKDLQFILPRASTVSRSDIEAYLPSDLEVKVVFAVSYPVMVLADLLLVASGTATLEAACAGTPMLVIYKVSLLNYLLAKPLIRVPYLGLVNIVAGRRIVPEFLQFAARPDRIARAGLDLLENAGKRAGMRQELGQVREKLGPPGASRRAAGVVLKIVEKKG